MAGKNKKKSKGNKINKNSTNPKDLKVPLFDLFRAFSSKFYFHNFV